MRDMVGCFSEHALRVSETTCSSYVNHQQFHPISEDLTPANQNTVTNFYKITLSTKKQQVLVTLTWSGNQIGHQGLNITFGDDPSSAAAFKLSTTSSRLFRKKKGTRAIEFDSLKIELLWDLTEANYESGVEPVNGFYVIIMVDSEVGLMLGDLCREVASKKLKNGSPMSKFSLVSRKEHYSGNTLFRTKARFSDCGNLHDVLIRFNGGNEGLKHPVLSVSIDKRTVMRVKRLQWNFRGNQTVFIDDLLIDLFWDVHGWFFNPGNGPAVFMFRRRSGFESRLWLEEKVVVAEKGKEQEKAEFSLLIYASKYCP